MGPETRDPGALGGTWDQGTLYDLVEPGSQDPLGKTLDPGTQNFQVRAGTHDSWSGTLMNNLLARKFECCNKSIDILLENKHWKQLKTTKRKILQGRYFAFN